MFNNISSLLNKLATYIFQFWLLRTTKLLEYLATRSLITRSQPIFRLIEENKFRDLLFNILYLPWNVSKYVTGLESLLSNNDCNYNLTVKRRKRISQKSSSAYLLCYIYIGKRKRIRKTQVGVYCFLLRK